MTRRTIAAAIVAGLVLSFTTGLSPAVAAPAQQPEGTRVYPWTDTDSPLNVLKRWEGDVENPWPATTPFALNSTFDPRSSGYTVEAWIKFPPGHQCQNTDVFCTYWSTMNIPASETGDGTADQWMDLEFKGWNTSTPPLGRVFRHRSSRQWTSGGGTATDTAGTSNLGSLPDGSTPGRAPTDWNLLTLTRSAVQPPRVAWNGRYTNPSYLPQSSYSWQNACVLGPRTCIGSMLQGAYVADVYIAYGALTDEDLLNRANAIASGEVDGPAELQLPDPDAFAPRLACGRTLHDMGGGQWFAQVHAVLRNPDADATDSAGYWRVSWEPGVQYPGKTATLPLPADASTSKSYYATYFMERSVAVGGYVAWSPTEEAAGDWRQNIDPAHVPNFGDPVIVPGWSWVEDAFGDTVFGGGGNSPGGGTLAFLDDQGNGVKPGPGGQVHTVRASCTVRVSPLAAAVDDDPDTIVVVIPPNPDDPDGGGPDGGGGDVDSCQDTGTRWNPFNWLEKLRCALGGIIGGIGDVLGGLMDGVVGLLRDIFNWLMERFGEFSFDFIEGLVPEWETKFPLSVIVDASDAIGVLHGALEDGLGGGGSDVVIAGVNDGQFSAASSSCGPVIDPNLDERASFVNGLPGVSAADLAGWKWSLPVPVPCPHQTADAQELADLQGMRRPIRAFLTISLVAAFLVKIVSSFGPRRNGLEIDGMEDPKDYLGRWDKTGATVSRMPGRTRE